MLLRVRPAGLDDGFRSQRIVSFNVSRSGRDDHPSSARAFDVSCTRHSAR